MGSAGYDEAMPRRTTGSSCSRMIRTRWNREIRIDSEPRPTIATRAVAAAAGRHGPRDADLLNESAWFALFSGQGGRQRHRNRHSGIADGEGQSTYSAYAGVPVCEGGQDEGSARPSAAIMDELDLDEPNDDYWYAFGRSPSSTANRTSPSPITGGSRNRNSCLRFRASYALAQMRLKVLKADKRPSPGAETLSAKGGSR